MLSYVELSVNDIHIIVLLLSQVMNAIINTINHTICTLVSIDTSSWSYNLIARKNIPDLLVSGIGYVGVFRNFGIFMVRSLKYIKFFSPSMPGDWRQDFDPLSDSNLALTLDITYMISVTDTKLLDCSGEQPALHR